MINREVLIRRQVCVTLDAEEHIPIVKSYKTSKTYTSRLLLYLLANIAADIYCFALGTVMSTMLLVSDLKLELFSEDKNNE